MRRRSITALVSAMMLSACAVPTLKIDTTTSGAPAGPTTPGATPWAVLSSAPTLGGAPRTPVQTGVTVTGAVKVPAGIIAAGGMNLVAAGSGNLVAAGSGNIIAAGGLNYSLLAVDEAPAAGAEVFLADAAGNPIPGLQKVKTDEKGNFSITNVPPDFTFVVAAEVTTKEGKKATFQTLAKPGKLGATAVVDAASTLVASNVLEDQKGGDLGDFNPAVFKTATETTAKNLAPEKLPDFSDRASVKAKMAAMVEAVTELKQSLTQLRTELSEVKKTLEDLRAELAKAAAANADPTGVAPRPGERPLPPGSPPPFDPTRPLASPLPGQLPPPNERPLEPLPSGMEPATCQRAGHQFLLPTGANPASIEFKIPNMDRPVEEWMNAATAKRDTGFWADVPEGCPHFVIFRDDRGTVTFKIENFVIKPGSPKEVRFDVPASTTTSPPPTTDPAASPMPSPAPTLSPMQSPPPGGTTCSEPRRHNFKVPVAGAHYLKFFLPFSATATAPQMVAGGQVNADGTTFTLSVPEGCPHDIKAFDATGKFLGGLKAFTIPLGAPLDFEIKGTVTL